LGDDLLSEKMEIEQAVNYYLGHIQLDDSQKLLAGLKSNGIELPDTKRETLIEFESRYPKLNLINEYRRIKALLTGYIQPIVQRINPKTGRIHAEYLQLGSVTGRFSGRKPNLQSIPRDKRFRSCFIAPPGSKFVIGDYSQMELRIAAEISQDPRMIQAYSQNVDLHKLTAAIVTGKQMQQVTGDERQAAKAINFGLIYAMGAEGLLIYARNTYGVKVSIEQAQDFRRRYFDFYAGIANWHKEVDNSRLQETRTLGNRRRVWKDSPPLTELLNTPVQGTSADILKRALCLLSEALQDTDSKIIGCVHDEIILEVPEENAFEVSILLKQKMVEAGQHYLKKISVELDVAVADNWAGK
jgi:DNA polymerase I-like protein with 3'-5' exonuclease and polymerase domains